MDKRVKRRKKYKYIAYTSINSSNNSYSINSKKYIPQYHNQIRSFFHRYITKSIVLLFFVKTIIYYLLFLKLIYI